MHTLLKKIIVSGLGVMLPAAASAMPAVMHVDEVTAGMRGTARTVIDSTGNIDSFNVDIIGIMGGQGKGSTPMIMAKASGPVIDETKGVMQGMSGSPVYVNGKLLGALSAGIKDTSPYNFFITPIDNMLPLWDMPDYKKKAPIKSFDLKKYYADKAKLEAENANSAIAADDKKNVTVPDTEKKVEIKQKPKAKEKKQENADKKSTTSLEPKSIWSFSGFDAQGLSYLKSQVNDFASGGTMIGGPTGVSHTRYNATLRPGDPIGVAVVYGDFTVGATGTVTAVDGQKVLAFGHSFMHRGNVNFFMTDARIVGPLPGTIGAGQKIANVGNIIGRINQDRDSGIAGKLGEFPSVVPVKVSVKNDGLLKNDAYTASIAYDESYLPKLTSSIAYAALSRTADTTGESTAKMHFTIYTNAVKSGKVERTNMYYSNSDVGQLAVSELTQAMNLICTNPEKEQDIYDVRVDMTVNSGRQTASLISAVPDKVKVKPGETVKFKTVIKPYRKDKETVTIPYTVPETQPEGLLNLDLRGGGLVPVSTLMLLQQTGIDVSASEDKTQTTADKLKAFTNKDTNNEIVIVPGAATRVLSEKEQKKLIKSALKAAQEAAAATKNKPKKINLLGDLEKDDTDTEKKPVNGHLQTNYIIDNVIHTALTIEK